MQGTDFAGFARSCAAVATGALGWPAGAFWDATWAELRVALEGRLGKRVTVAPLGAAELRALKEQMPDA